DITNEIINCSRDNNITKIVLGKNLRPYWKTYFYENLTDKIIRQSGEIDIYLITYESTRAKSIRKIPVKRFIPWSTYGFAILFVAITTLIAFPFVNYLHATNILMLYFITITIVALFGRIGPSILASILSVVT